MNASEKRLIKISDIVKKREPKTIPELMAELARQRAQLDALIQKYRPILQHYDKRKD